MRQARKPEIMADAAYAVFSRPSRELTGRFLIDDNFLAENGVADFDQLSRRSDASRWRRTSSCRPRLRRQRASAWRRWFAKGAPRHCEECAQASQRLRRL
jgi:hypothetical protein